MFTDLVFDVLRIEIIISATHLMELHVDKQLYKNLKIKKMING